MARFGGDYRDRDPRRDRSLWEMRRAFLAAFAEEPEAGAVLRALGGLMPLFRAAREATKASLRDPWMPALWDPARPVRFCTRPVPLAGQYGHCVDAARPPIENEPASVPFFLLWRFERGDWSDEAVSTASELRHLRDALVAWGKRWRLDAGWALDAALRTLYEWDNGRSLGCLVLPPFVAVADAPPFSFALPSGRGSRERLVNAMEAWHASGGTEAAAEMLRQEARAYFSPPTFVGDPWVPEWTTAQQYRAAVRAAFEQQYGGVATAEDWRAFAAALDQYIKRRVGDRRATLEPSPRKNASLDDDDDARSESRAFRWLALACAGMTARAIAARYNAARAKKVTAEAVRASNRRTAAALDLPWTAPHGRRRN